MAKIVIVDDDRELLNLEEIYLEQAGFEVETFDKPIRAMEFLQSNEPDLLILDIMMPEMDGYSMINELRREHFYPIIFVSAKTAPQDTVKGLLLGGDDYIKKPFNPMEFTAKVKSILRYRERIEKAENTVVFENERVSIDFKKGICIAEGEKVELTQTEWKLLKILYDNKGESVSSEDLFYKLTGEDYYDKACSSVATHIRNIRRKLKDDDLIHTAWGKGYSFEDEG